MYQKLFMDRELSSPPCTSPQKYLEISRIADFVAQNLSYNLNFIQTTPVTFHQKQPTNEICRFVNLDL